MVTSFLCVCGGGGGARGIPSATPLILQQLTQPRPSLKGRRDSLCPASLITLESYIRIVLSFPWRAMATLPEGNKIITL